MQRHFQVHVWNMIALFWRVSFLSLCFAATIHVRGGDAAAIAGAKGEVTPRTSTTASWIRDFAKRFELGGSRRGIENVVLEHSKTSHPLLVRRNAQSFATDTDSSANNMADSKVNADEQPQGLTFGQQQREQQQKAQAPLKVMIVGDSLSHGVLGTWTWRYRLWQWTQKQHLDFKFVGPYNGTYSEDQNHTTIGEYAKDVDVEFLSNCYHFAHWGRSAFEIKETIKGVQQQYQAELMLVMLGFNDMVWRGFDGRGALNNVHELLDAARTVTPNLKFAVANVPHRTYIGFDDVVEKTNEFNYLLPDEIASWSTAESPIHLTDIAKSYDCHEWACPVGYDGLHPNKLGAYQLAEAFTMTLVNDFHLGASPLVVPNITITPNMTDPYAKNLPQKPANGSVPFAPLHITQTSNSAIPVETSTSTAVLDVSSIADHSEQPTTTSTTLSMTSTSSDVLEAITQPGQTINTDIIPTIVTSSAASVPSADAQMPGAVGHHTSTWTLGFLNFVVVLGCVALGACLWRALRKRRPRHVYELAPLSEESADDGIGSVSSGVDDGFKNWGHD